MKNVTVIGGSGFLGNEVAKELVKRDFKVKIFDKKKPSFSSKNLDYIQGDILNTKNLKQLYKEVLTYIILLVLQI